MAVNPAITDAVTQTNVQVVASAPAVALAQVYVATAQALALAAQNATAAQANGNAILQATTTRGVALLYGRDTAANAVALARLLARR